LDEPGFMVDAMIHAHPMIECSDLTRQTEIYWWAIKNLRRGHHSGAYWVLRILRKCGKSEQLKHSASKVLTDKGYAEHVAAADWWPAKPPPSNAGPNQGH
jgi:hypothetical protein